MLVEPFEFAKKIITFDAIFKSYDSCLLVLVF